MAVHRIVLLGVLLLITSVLSGCGLGMFADPKTNPVIVNYAGFPLGKQSTVAFALTSERRMILVQDDAGRACAEPSPDSAENIASQIKLALEAQVKEPKIEAAGRLDFGKDLLTSVQQLFRRSQGIQLFRDGAFALCQQFLNRVLEPADYKTKMSDLLKTAAQLIEKELDKTNGVIGGPPPTILPILPGETSLAAKGVADASDFGRGVQLAATVRRKLEIVKDTRAPAADKAQAHADIKSALKQLFVILQPNAIAIHDKKDEKDKSRTMTDVEFRALLDQVRQLAKVNEQPSLATADDIASLSDVNAFLGKFPTPS